MERGRPRPGIALAVAALLLVTVPAAEPAAAYHKPAGPLIARGGDPGSGWVALTFRTDGSPASAEVLGYLEKLRPHVEAIYLYDGSGDFVFGISTAGGDFGALGTKVLVDVGVVRYEIYDEYDSNSYGGMSMQVTPNPGVYTYLVVGATPGPHWSWTFEGGPGVELLAAATGEEAIRAYDREFEASVNVQAWSIVGAHVMVDARTSFEVRDTWVGGFVSVPPMPGNLLTLSTPSGEVECDCSFPHLTGSNSAEPGPYTARATGVSPSNVMVWGADARLPALGAMLTFTDGTSAVAEAGGRAKLVMRLTDAGGRGIEGGEILVTLEGSDGPQEVGAMITDADGIARAEVAVPSEAGFYPVRARLTGDPASEATASFVLQVGSS